MSPPTKYRRLLDDEGQRKACAQPPKKPSQNLTNQSEPSSASSSPLNDSDIVSTASHSRPQTSSTRSVTSTSQATTAPSRGSIPGRFTTASSSATKQKAERDSKAQQYKDTIWPPMKVDSKNSNAANEERKTVEQARQETLDRLNGRDVVERPKRPNPLEGAVHGQEDGAVPAPRNTERQERKKKKKTRNPFKRTWEVLSGWIEEKRRDKNLDPPRPPVPPKRRPRGMHSGQTSNAGTMAFDGWGAF